MTRKFCSYPFKYVFVMADGVVRSCGWLNLPLGNLLTQDMDEIWNSENAKLARESIIDDSYRYCHKMVCPFCNNNALEELDEDIFTRRAIADEFPREINVSLDYTCNHACPSCRNEIYKPSKECLLNLQVMIEKLKPYLDKAQAVSTNGNGDVFASKHMMDMLASLQPARNDFRLFLETNGALFTPQNWEKISHLAKHYLTLSVTPNSFDRNTFKYLSGGFDNLDKVIENLHFAKSLRNTGHINRLTISIVAQERNFLEVPSFVQRCLEEFSADKVVIKPIFPWFGLSEEDYWFKNVRNPLHPYHKEWIEMMKSPILRDSRVSHWGGKDATEAFEHPFSRAKANEEILLKLIEIEKPGESLRDTLGADRRIAICTVDVKDKEDYTARYVGKILSEAKMKVCFLRRFSPTQRSINNIDSFGFPDIDFGQVDTIIVTDSLRFEKLKTDIINHGFSGEILSLAEAVERL